MQWFQCRSCRRSTPLSRVSGWVQQWTAGHVSHFCAQCRDAAPGQAGQGSAATSTAPPSRASRASQVPTVRREYFVDPYGLVRTRPVRPDGARATAS